MPEFTTDDKIHRFQGRWIDARGSALPVAARYSAWAFGVLSLLPVLLFLRLLRMPLLPALAATILLACLIGKVCADRLNGEWTVGAWGGAIASTIRSHNRAKARTKAQAAPYRIEAFTGRNHRHRNL